MVAIFQARNTFEVYPNYDCKSNLGPITNEVLVPFSSSLLAPKLFKKRASGRFGGILGLACMHAWVDLTLTGKLGRLDGYKLLLYHYTISHRWSRGKRSRNGCSSSRPFSPKQFRYQINANCGESCQNILNWNMPPMEASEHAVDQRARRDVLHEDTGLP